MLVETTLGRCWPIDDLGIAQLWELVLRNQ